MNNLENLTPALPDEVISQTNEITRLIFTNINIQSCTIFFSNLVATEQSQDRSAIAARRGRANTSDSSSNSQVVSLADHLFKDYINELNGDPSRHYNSNIKRGIFKEMTNKAKNKKNKKMDKVNEGKSSYIVLNPINPLEPNMLSNFMLNRKYRNIEFGFAGSVPSVDEISDDELGITRKNFNSKYNINILNNHFDDIADVDTLTRILIYKYAKQQSTTDSSASMKKSHSLSNLSDDIVIQQSCILQTVINDTYNEMHQYPRMFPIDFSPSLQTRNNPIKYIEMLTMLTIIANVEKLSMSLKIGCHLQETMRTIRYLLKYAINNPQQTYHFVGDLTTMQFFVVLQQISNSLIDCLLMPKNHLYQLYMDLFQQEKVYCDILLESIAQGIATEIDCGGWYAREFIKFREYTIALDLHCFKQLVVAQCYRNQSTEHLIDLCRSISTYQELYGLHIKFTKESEVLFEFHPVESSLSINPIYPYFNMFSLGLEFIDNSSQYPS